MTPVSPPTLPARYPWLEQLHTCHAKLLDRTEVFTAESGCDGTQMLHTCLGHLSDQARHQGNMWKHPGTMHLLATIPMSPAISKGSHRSQRQKLPKGLD